MHAHAPTYIFIDGCSYVCVDVCAKDSVLRNGFGDDEDGPGFVGGGGRRKQNGPAGAAGSGKAAGKAEWK